MKATPRKRRASNTREESNFLEFYGKSLDEILTERKDDLTPRPNETMVEAKQRSSRYEKLLEKFYAWMSEQGYKRNSMYTNCKGLRQLFRYYNMGLTLRNGSPITQVAISTDDFVLKPEHVKKMFHCAKDLRSKLLISMGNDLGWRIGDVLSIRRDELPDSARYNGDYSLTYIKKDGARQPTLIIGDGGRIQCDKNEWNSLDHQYIRHQASILISLLKKLRLTATAKKYFSFNKYGDQIKEDIPDFYSKGLR